MIIAIGGCSGSGKTTLVNELLKAFSENQISHVSTDSYYKDQKNLSPYEREKVNYDHPDSIDHELFFCQLQNLAMGKMIERPIYDFVTHTRSNKKEVIVPHEIIIIDGIFSLCWQNIRSITNIKVYMDVPSDICFIRRLMRDILERGRNMENVIEQYLTSVRPMQEEYIIPTKKYADFVIAEGGLNEIAMKNLVELIKKRLKY